MQKTTLHYRMEILKFKTLLRYSLTLNGAQLFEAGDRDVDGLLGRFVHKIKGGDINPDCEQLEGYSREGTPLYLRHRHLLHPLEFLLRVRSVTFAGRFPPRSPRPLPRLCL